MKRSEFAKGVEFWTGSGKWRCTGLVEGRDAIVAICIESNFGGNLPESWFIGPPYAVEEHVFDENELDWCSLNKEDIE